MSAIFPNDANKYLSASTLTGLSTNGRILICTWYKWDGTAASSTNMVVDLSQAATDAAPRVGIAYGSTPTQVCYFDAVTVGVTGTLSSGTWYHGASAYGPWDNNGTRARRAWRDGSLTSSAVALNQPSIDLAYLSVGRWVNSAAAAHKGRAAQVGIWAGLTTGQEDTVVAEAQLYHVDLISIPPNYSWRLSSAVTAATGGIDLTNNGTVTFDSGDDPPVGEPSGGGASLIVSSCFM